MKKTLGVLGCLLSLVGGACIAVSAPANAIVSTQHNLRCDGGGGAAYCDLANEGRNDFYNIVWSVNYTVYDRGDYRISLSCTGDVFVRVDYDQTSGVNGSESMWVTCD